MNIFLTSMISLLPVAVFVAIAARRLRLPYTVGLLSNFGSSLCGVSANSPNSPARPIAAGAPKGAE